MGSILRTCILSSFDRDSPTREAAVVSLQAEPDEIREAFMIDVAAWGTVHMLEESLC